MLHSIYSLFSFENAVYKYLVFIEENLNVACDIAIISITPQIGLHVLLTISCGTI